jgi:hypothetical protein
VAQHLTEGAWDDTELALLCWPARVAEKCLDDPALANTLRLNLPPKRTKSAVTRWVRELADAGCPDLAEALLATLSGESGVGSCARSAPVFLGGRARQVAQAAGASGGGSAGDRAKKVERSG